MNKSSFIFAGVKQRDDKKIAQIFSATLKLVAEKGVAGVTMRQVAKEAGLATGTVYIYFTDKNKLLNQLYASCRASSVSAYFRGYEDSLAFKSGFRIVWDNILQHRMENFEESVFLEQCFHSPFITAPTREMSRQLLQPLFKLIEKGKQEKFLKDLDTVMLLIFMVGSITEVIKYVKYHQKKITIGMIQEAFGVCWDGLAR